MAKQKARRFDLADKLLLWAFLGIVLLILLQNITLLVSLAAFASLLASFYYWFQFYTQDSDQKKLQNVEIDQLHRLSNKEFTLLFIALFRKKGYKVRKLPDSHDYGADFLLFKENRTIAVQAKNCKEPIGPGSIQQAAGAKAPYWAHEAWVVTNHTFTESASHMAELNYVRLIDRSYLIDLISEAKKAAQQQEARTV